MLSIQEDMHFKTKEVNAKLYVTNPKKDQAAG